MEKVVLTGASGFIGVNLLHHLLDAGVEVTALYKNAGEHILRHERIHRERADILNTEHLTELFEGADTLFHCAAHISFRSSDLDTLSRINIDGTRSVLTAAQRSDIRKVVHMSAGSVLGFSPGPGEVIDETHDPEISSHHAYAYTKKKAEDVVRDFVRSGMDVSIANSATVYGRGDWRMNSGTIIKALKDGKLKFVPCGGTSFVDADDLARGLLLLAQEGLPGERYIFVGGNLTYQELAERISAVMGISSSVKVLPRLFYYPALFAGKLFDLKIISQKDTALLSESIIRESFGYKYYTSEKATRQLGWQPRNTLEDAVKKALEFYQEHNLL